MDLMVLGIRQRVQEIGRIRMGDKDQRGLPVKLSTFRLTSYDRSVLDVAADLYGGEVREWKDAPDPGMWELVTAASALDILLPRALQSVTQGWELWQGGACSRRCDGRFEEIAETACVCGESRGQDGFCEVITRLSVILPRLPGLGVWRLDTGGWHAATTIPATLELLMALDARPMVPAVLRAVQRSSKVKENGKTMTHRFVVPVLDAPGITIGQLVDSASNDAALLGDGQPERPRPPTAEERVAARRALVEARPTSAGEGSSGVPEPSSAPTPEPALVGEVIEADPEPQPERCAGFHDALGRCRMFTGHAGKHTGQDGERFA